MIDLVRRPGDLARLADRAASWKSEPPAAVILGASPNGLSFARSLGKRGVPVLLLEGPKPEAGLRTRYALTALLPDPVDEEGRWLEILDSIGGAARSRPVLIPTGDAHVLLVSRNRARLERGFRFLLPSAEILEQLPDKRAQYGLAEKHGIPVPRTVYPSTEAEAERAGNQVGYPCIVKPHVGHLWRRRKEKKLEQVGDAAALLRVFREASGIGQSVMIQEIIPGGDDTLYGLLAYYDHDSRPLCLLTKRKLRQYPVGYGDGSFQVTLRVPEVRDLGDRFFRALGYRGLGSVEFKKDTRTGEYKLIEINPRSVSGQGMTTAAGMDIPYLAYLDIGEVRKVEPTESFREHVYFVNERWDFLSFLENRRRGNLTLRSWIGGFLGRKVACAWFSWKDPLPALALLGTALRNRLRR
jgi:predicted ATP-grasp superfamily ATP-dependent carboligase